MPTEFKIGQYLEWCTDIPSLGEIRQSPVFLLNGNEWIIDITPAMVGEEYGISLSLVLKNEVTDSEPCRAKCQIGFKNEETLSLWNEEIIISPSLRDTALLPFIPWSPNFSAGNCLKIVLSFADLAQLIVKVNRNNAGYISPDLQLLDPNFCLDFDKMLQDGLDHDVELKCGDSTWKVHKNVLSVRSKVLQAMLDSDMIEGRTRVIRVRDMDVPTVELFLNYLYYGKLPEMTMDFAKRFYVIGDQYAVDCLKRLCVSYMVRNITPEAACEILVIAHEHSDSSFKESVLNFITVKKLFMNDDLWHDFRESYPKLAFEVYDRFCKSYRLTFSMNALSIA